ncbi:hypothetical protein U8335_02325 [Roseiconus lacunae]|uniref:hypothetical protein n=1 Tax=Roseiconus lacunae TaxID=2605694 RepID=UPI00308E467F|nr:hypothetical protein U8335_02325 [Stieleria sp. HD01]
MVKSISQTDANDLERLEAIVHRGKKTFIKVGNALSEIRDRKLYQASHKTFAAYVEDRFGFKRHNAYQLIDAAAAAKNVEHVQQIDNARQAAEVAKAPKEKQTEVVERAAEIATDTGKPLTAKVLSEARAEVCPDEDTTPPKGRALKRRKPRAEVLVDDGNQITAFIEDAKSKFCPAELNVIGEALIAFANQRGGDR